MKKCGVPLAWKSSAESRCRRRSSSCTCASSIASAHLRRVQPHSSRPSRGRRPRASAASRRAVVRVPEALVALLGERLHRELRGRLGAGVERERLVLPDEANLVAVLRRGSVFSVGSTRLQNGHWKSRELDDRDERRSGRPGGGSLPMGTLNTVVVSSFFSGGLVCSAGRRGRSSCSPATSPRRSCSSACPRRSSPAPSGAPDR